MRQAKHTIILYNPRAVFYTMPLGLLAIGSRLDSARYNVKIIDARHERDPHGAILTHLSTHLNDAGALVVVNSPGSQRKGSSLNARVTVLQWCR